MAKPDYTEEELVSLLKDKNELAFDVLYNKYSAALYGLSKRIIGSDDEACDILQEAFIKIWKTISTYDSLKGKLFTWLLKITRNTAIDHLRAKKNLPTIQNDEILVYMENENIIPVESIGLKEHISKLGADQKEIINVLYYMGYTQQEASKRLNIPLGTLKSRARNAILELRNLMKD